MFVKHSPKKSLRRTRLETKIPEETIVNETLQATTRLGHNGRGQAKAQTELTCAVSQAEHILTMLKSAMKSTYL